MSALIDLVVGEGAEFKMLLESAPEHVKGTLHSSIQSYLSPRSVFSFTLTHENNPNLFKFIRAYKPLKLNPDVFKYIINSKEQLLSYGAMLGFIIAHLVSEDFSREEVNNFVKICEKIILLGGTHELIHIVGRAFVSLKQLKQNSPITLQEIQALENSLHNATSIEHVLSILREITKINRIVNPKLESRWLSSPQLA